MIRELTIHSVTPWKALNEMEGQMDATIKGILFCLYTSFWSEDEWKEFKAGDRITAKVFLERGSVFRIMPPGTPFEITQKEGVMYRVCGRNMGMIDGLIHLASSEMDIAIDPDPGPAWVNEVLEQLKGGEIILVEGTLKADIHPFDGADAGKRPPFSVLQLNGQTHEEIIEIGKTNFIPPEYCLFFLAHYKTTDDAPFVFSKLKEYKINPLRMIGFLRDVFRLSYSEAIVFFQSFY